MEFVAQTRELAGHSFSLMLEHICTPEDLADTQPDRRQTQEPAGTVLASVSGTLTPN
ncbi:hypothetical protein Anapl_04955 [Anas platyrhynchos]|uniref:Uncharacterized protein n=1 Tax=Anas platyrhynchos TaxID=8839 RepID=R0KVZ2_ANAPL|nr:hypothetical protein Anapl_04955 [Anas platyrhynchos]